MDTRCRDGHGSKAKEHATILRPNKNRYATHQAKVKSFAQHCWGFPVLSAGEFGGETWRKTHVLLEPKHVEQTQLWVCPRIRDAQMAVFIGERHYQHYFNSFSFALRQIQTKAEMWTALMYLQDWFHLRSGADGNAGLCCFSFTNFM